MYFGIFKGGWRIFPAIYTVALVVVAILTFVIVPRRDKMAGEGKPIREMLVPLKHMRVWRFSLYYAAVFGAYVALSAWLPKYYVDNFGIELKGSRAAHHDLHLPRLAAATRGRLVQ